MIHHILKIIWNERRINAWIVLEYVLVFCVLWFCCDFLIFMGKRYFEPTGFHIDHVYDLQMIRESATQFRTPEEHTDEQKIESDYTHSIMERVRQYLKAEIFVRLLSVS